MADDKNRLGRGLEAIFGENVNSVLEEIQHTHANSAEALPVEVIHPNPYQPRTHFDEVDVIRAVRQAVAQAEFGEMVGRVGVEFA